MSTTRDAFEAWLRDQLMPLPWLPRFHTVHRLYEKIRRIHNAVGDVYQHRITISEFQQQYPAVYARIAPELAPYADNGYLTEAGWLLFLNQMFEPRHDGIIAAMLILRQMARDTAADAEIEPFADP